MMDHFNGLTPAEAERLAMLAEECGEVVQVIGKILRHGYDSYHPDRPEVTNRTLLREEVTDLLAVLRLMDGNIPAIAQAQVQAACEKKLRFSHHQHARCAETGPPDPGPQIPEDRP